jgi:hypothetical protein
MLQTLLDDVILKTLKYEKSDFKILDWNDEVWLFSIHLNDVFCGMLCLSTKEDLAYQTKILTHQIMNSELDFIILMNDKNAVIVMTDHSRSIIPQYVPTNNRNLLELVCSKPFMKNLIANRGVEYYD